jgi:hypothetical protein
MILFGINLPVVEIIAALHILTIMLLLRALKSASR